MGELKMADTAPPAPEGESGGRGRGEGFGDRRGRRGGDRGGRGGRRREGPAKEAEEWVPVTKLGRLVAAKKIETLEEIFVHSLPIKEEQIVDRFLDEKVLKNEVMKVMSVQKQTRAGQRTRFKAFVCIGDENGHVGLGWKHAKEVQGSIKGALTSAKLSIIPIRRGYCGNKIGAPHTLPMKVTGKCGSVRVRLIPAPRGTAIVGAPVSKKVLQFAGVSDCYTCSSGKTRTTGNFLKATFDALSKTYSYLSPDLWAKRDFEQNPFQKFNQWLKETDFKRLRD